MLSTSSPAARKRHPAHYLELVVAAYAGLTSSDSIIERDFGRVKKLFGEHRLNCNDQTRSDLVIVLLSDPLDDKKLINTAKDVWAELYADVRRREGTRFDNVVRVYVLKHVLIKMFNECITHNDETCFLAWTC